MTSVTASETGSWRGRLAAFAADIKLSHSVFALPFALLAGVMAASRPGAAWGLWTFVLIVAAMVCARTAAMGANRLLDAEIDRANPRTAGRAIPARRLGRGYVAGMIALFGAGFIVAAAGFGVIYGNWWPAVLAGPVLGYLCVYPLLKRVTALCHLYLGAALGLAPLCAWIAVRGELAGEPLLMLLAVACWTAGFDVIYATSDAEHDRRHGLHSLPAAVGVRRALLLSRGLHVASIVALVGLGLTAPELGLIWWLAVAAVAGLLVYEHSIVRPEDLSRVNVAFFTLNGVISVLLGIAGVVDILA